MKYKIKQYKKKIYVKILNCLLKKLNIKQNNYFVYLINKNNIKVIKTLEQALSKKKTGEIIRILYTYDIE